MPLGIGIWELLLLGAFWAYSIPAYVVASRRDVPQPGLAFIPWVGPFIVLLRAARRSGWLAFLLLLSALGALILDIMIALNLPRSQGRSGWWTLALMLPVVNIVAYFVYAFTLEPRPAELQPSSAVVADLAHLSNLHAAGLLNDEKFAAAKAELLA